ncbi:xanthine dehydrogenase family protein subunit M [soil metagenome]
MQPFKFTRSTDAASAVKAAAANPDSRFVAGGSNIVDLMRECVERPSELVDISRLAMSQIKPAAGGGVSLGALARNTDTANHPLIRQGYPLLSQAILSGASAQIRNMATNGGNVMQRVRCPYFYDITRPCNRREPGSECSAITGMNRNHAIFAWTEKCVAVNPSDMCVALVALDAVLKIQSPGGKERSLPLKDLHHLPGDVPGKEFGLAHDELITSIELAKSNFAANSYYLKVRDRSSFAFALVSVAVGLEMSGQTIKRASVALGGVAHKPWRAPEAEAVLTGKAATEVNFKLAAEVAMKNAMPLEHNEFKVELGKRAIVLALKRALNGKA